MGVVESRYRQEPADYRDGVYRFQVPVDYDMFDRIRLVILPTEGGVGSFTVCQSITGHGEEVRVAESQPVEFGIVAGLLHTIDLRSPEVSRRYQPGDYVEVEIKPTSQSAGFSDLHLVFIYRDKSED